MDKRCNRMDFSTTFEPITGVTQRFIDNAQSILENESFETNILPVPEIIQEDVPRVIAVSNGKHSQIILSKINCSITTNFDQNFNSDLEKCMDYFSKKVSTIDKIIKSLNTDNVLKLKFLGITTELICDAEDAVTILSNNLAKVKLEDICDIDLQVTHIVEQRYYVNIRISNTRLFEKNVNSLSYGFLKNTHKNGIRIVIDINNRYAFSKGVTEEQKCDLREIEKIKSLLEETIRALPVIFGGGIFDG